MNDTKLDLAQNFSQQELKEMLENHFDWLEDGSAVFTMDYFVKESTQAELNQLKHSPRFDFGADYVVILNNNIKSLDDLTQALTNEEWSEVLWDNVPYGNGAKTELSNKVADFLN